MTQGRLTLGIADSGASDFVSSPIPSLEIFRWTSAGAPQRGRQAWASIAQTSVNGTTQIIGPSYSPRFLWPITTVMTLAEMRQLSNLASYQDDQYKQGNDGKLRLIDETAYIDNFDRQANGRSLLSELSESWNTDYKYGHGVFNVKLQIPETFNTELGRLESDSSIVHTVSFLILEV